MRLGARLFASLLIVTMYLPVAAVQAAGPDTFVFTNLGATEVAGAADATITVTATLGGGATDFAYAGTAHFTSSDGSATLPANQVFDGSTGVITISATFKTAGRQHLTATDTLDGTITGDSPDTSVAAGTAVLLNVTGSIGDLSSGSVRVVTATVTDTWGNGVPNETVIFTRSAGTGSVSGLTGPSTDGSGVATDNVTGLLAGPVTVQADDSGLIDTLPFTVVAGGLNHVLLTPPSAAIAPGGSQPFTTKSYDAAGNQIADVTGTAVLTISPNGSCDTTSCTASVGGSHTVTTTYLTKTDTSTLTVGDNPPVGVTDSLTVLENALTTPVDVLGNDTDPENDPLTVTAVTNPGHGTATLDGDHLGVHYFPDPNYNGPDSFTYTVSDGTLTDSGTVNVTVTHVNQVPSFTKGANQSVLENSGAHSVTNWATSISRGADPTESGQAVNFILTDDNPSLFSVLPAVSPTGTLTYTSATNANGLANLTVKIHDNGGVANGGADTSATQSFTIGVTGVNQAPTFNGGGNDTTLEDSGAQTVPGWATSIDAGAPNESGQTLDFIVSNNNNGLFSAQPSVNATGTMTYTPAPNANGVATVSVSLHDNGGIANGGVDTSGVQTMTITVTAVNDAPTWTKGPDQVVLENSGAKTVTGWASAFSEGPPDEVISQTLSIATSNNNNSLFSVQPVVTFAGTLAFTPAANQFGSATVTVTVSDDGGTANGGVDHLAKTFVINVTGVNQVPTFNGGGNDVVNEDSGAQSIPGWATNMDAGAPNESGQVLSFIVVNTNNALFSVQPSVDATGNLTYTPAANANGLASVSVRIHDDGGVLNGGVDTSIAQTMTITVTAVNDAPTFTDPADQTVNEDAGAQIVAGLAAPTSAGPANESAQVLTFLVTNDNNALFSVQPNLDPLTGTLTYTPAPNANGSATVTAKLIDGGGTTNGGADRTTHLFSITVNSVNDAPTFSHGANISLPEESSPSGHTVANFVTGFSPGPPNESGQSLVGYTVTNDHNLFSTQPTISSAGTLTYTLAANRNGTAIVSITAQDNGGTGNGGVDTSAIQTFTITVVGVDHPPAAINDFPTIVQGSRAVKIDALINDTDPDNDILTVVAITRQGTSGHAAVAADHKSVNYDPTGSFIGTDTFQYSVSDGRGQLAFGTVLVTVVRDTFAPIATPPVAWLMQLPVNTTATIALTFSANDVGFGVKYFILQESRNRGPWVNVPVVVGARNVHRVVAIGSLYTYRVRAVDLVGNGGTWVYLGNITPTLVQEPAATYTGTWTSLRLPGSLGGRINYATVAGATSTFSCTCSSLAWIGLKGPTRGSAKVYVDGVLVATYTEKSTTNQAPQAVFARTWGTIGSHTVKIVVLGTGRIDVDGFLTIQ